MNNQIPLYALKCGESAKVVYVDPDAELYDRLRELGIIEGTTVQKKMSSPLGDPCAYTVRGALIAVRRSDAESIKVERPEEMTE